MYQPITDAILICLFFGNVITGIIDKNWAAAIGWSMAIMCMLRIMFVH